MIAQGDVWWTDMGEPVGSAPGYRRPVIVVQGDLINASRIATVVVVPLTSNMKWADAPGNVRIPAGMSGLDSESVANVSLIVAVDKTTLADRVGKISARHLAQVFGGIDLILGR